MATILVVDDEEPIVALLGDVLEEAGYRVVVAHDGCEALRLAHQEKPDLVLSDVMMPGMDGARLAEALGNDPEMSATAVILMSAGKPPSIATARAVTFIGKPFAIEHVVALVTQYVVA